MIDTTTVGKGIAFLRKQRQMTQQGLAAAMNVSHQAVSKWENGIALPDMQTMLALSRLFGVSMENMLSGAVLEAAAEAPAEQAAPGIELKLDSGELDMRIVAEADEVIDRAMEQCEAEEEKHAAAPEATVNVGMSFDELMHMAPYVSSDSVEAMLDICKDEYSVQDIAKIAPFVRRERAERLLENSENMDWQWLRRLGPFISRDAMRDVILKHVADLTMEDLRRLAPFLSRDAISDVLRQMPPCEDLEALKRLAPFMSKDSLAEQLHRCIDRLTVENLLAFAPYLQKERLGELVQQLKQPIDRSQIFRLAKFLPREQIDRLVISAMGRKRPQGQGSDWNMSDEWNRACQEIRDVMHTGMHEAREAMRLVGLDGVVDGINSTMKDVGGRINEAINTAWGAQTQRSDPAQERARRIRTRIAEKALTEGNWDWICGHIADLDGDLLKQVLMNCAAAGHAELIAAHMERLMLSSAECCRLAQTVQDEALWGRLLERMEPEHRRRVLDYIARVRPDALAQFDQMRPPLEQAIELLRTQGDAAGAMALLDAEDQLALLREMIGEAEALVPHMAQSIIPQAMELLLENGLADTVGMLAAQADPAALPQMAHMLATHDAWQYLDELLSGAADVDLSAVWPLAVRSEHWEAIDPIALHGDDATLCAMAQALADLERYAELEPFIEELDPDTLEQLLDKAMEQSNWAAIDRIGDLLN